MAQLVILAIWHQSEPDLVRERIHVNLANRVAHYIPLVATLLEVVELLLVPLAVVEKVVIIQILLLMPIKAAQE